MNDAERRDRLEEDWRVAFGALFVEMDRLRTCKAGLEARVLELESVVDLTRVVLDSRFHDLIPTNGEWVRLHRSDIENVLLRAKAAVDAERG